MIKRLTIIKDTFNIILQSMIYYVIVLYLFTILDGYNINYILPVICGLFIILSYLNNKYSKNLIIFSIINATAVTILFLCPLISNVKILFILVFAIIIINSYSTWGKKGKKSYINTPSIYYEFVFILCFMINSNRNVSNVIFVLGIIYILLNYLTNYISNIISFMYYNIDNKNLKMGKILNVNNYYISFFYIASIVIILLSKILRLDYIFTKLITPFLLLIQKILQITLGNLINNIGIEKGKKISNNFNGQIGNIQKQEPNAFMKFISILIRIGFILIKILIIFLVIYIIYKLIKLIINYYKKDECSIDEVEYIKNDNTKSIFSYLFKLKSKKIDNTNNGKIRKIYYKKITKLKKHIPIFNDTLTPNEIEKQLNANNYSIDLLTKIYEKARYSNLKCTDTDVNNAKKQ